MDPAAFFYLDCTFITLFTTRNIGHRLPKGQLQQERWGHRTVKVHRSRRVPANKTFHVLQSVRSIYNFTFLFLFELLSICRHWPSVPTSHCGSGGRCYSARLPNFLISHEMIGFPKLIISQTDSIIRRLTNEIMRKSIES
jgi:hypothetical protein